MKRITWLDETESTEFNAIRDDVQRFGFLTEDAEHVLYLMTLRMIREKSDLTPETFTAYTKAWVQTLHAERGEAFQRGWDAGYEVGSLRKQELQGSMTRVGDSE